MSNQTSSATRHEPAPTIDETVIRWNTPATQIREQLQTKPLLVLLHGYGSFEGDLIQLASVLPEQFIVASLRAPHTAPAPIVNGYEWFPVGHATSSKTEREATLTASAHAVLAWLDKLYTPAPADTVNPRQHSTPAHPKISIMGFSQGGAMVTTLMRTAPERFACAVNCSGFVVHDTLPADTKLETLRPALFWGRDPEDPVIPAAAITKTAEFLPRHFTLEKREYAGIAHSISAHEVADISAFLIKHATKF